MSSFVFDIKDIDKTIPIAPNSYLDGIKLFGGKGSRQALKINFREQRLSL